MGREAECASHRSQYINLPAVSSTLPQPLLHIAYSAYNHGHLLAPTIRRLPMVPLHRHHLLRPHPFTHLNPHVPHPPTLSPMNINTLTLWSATPIHILHAQRPDPITIQSAAHLSPSFARGWNTLPDELKLHILACNLVERFPQRLFTAESCCHRLDASELFKQLRSTPEITALNSEPYYSRNVFVLEPRVVRGTQLNPPYVLR